MRSILLKTLILALLSATLVLGAPSKEIDFSECVDKFISYTASPEGYACAVTGTDDGNCAAD